MRVQRPVKRWGWVLIIPAIAVLGIGLWIGFSSADDLLKGQHVTDQLCNSDNPVLLTPSQPIADLAVDGQSLYWVRRGNPGSVMSMAKSNGKIEVLATIQSEPYGILVDKKSVYWVEGTWQPDSSFILKEVDKQGGEATEVWRAAERMTQLSMEGDHLYWLEYESQEVMRIAKRGGEPEVLASDLDGVNYFTIVNGQTYLGGDEWLGALEPQDQTPRILITTDQLIRELQIGLRDERSVTFAGPVIGEYANEIIFVFYVGNNPGMISCTDNAAHIVGLPQAGGISHIILSVEGSLNDIVLMAPYLYSIGNCRGGQMVDMDSGEVSAMDIGYDAFNLAADKNHLYWTDREGLKCMRRLGE